MSAIRTFDTVDELARAAAKATVDILWATINKYDNATWVLAGGSTPIATYLAIVTSHQQSIDWTKVTVMMGDERMVPADSPENNWNAANRILGILPTRKLKPQSDVSAEESAANYERYLNLIPKGDNGFPRFDLVWLGVGEDGHTLSLFPDHKSLYPSNNLIIPVHNSPKPPADRISFSLRALQGAQDVMILASGSNKQPAVRGALTGNNSPIALAASVVEAHDGNVTWFIDSEAAASD